MPNVKVGSRVGKNWVYLFRHKSFTLLFLSQATASAGTWTGYIVIPLALYQITHDPLSIGILMLCRMLPAFVLGPWVSWQIRKHTAERILLVATLVHGIAFLFYIFANSPSIYYLLAVIIAVSRAFSIPAKQSLIPKILAREKLAYANSALSGVEQMSMFIGPAVGGFLLHIVGAKSTLAICTLAYFISFATLLLLKKTRDKETASFTEKTAAALTLAVVTAAWREIFSKKWLSLLIIGDAIAALAFGALNVVIPVLSETVFPKTPAIYGYFISALGVGIFVGTVAGPVLQGRLNAILLYIGSTLLAASALCLFGGSSLIAVSLMAIFFVGAGNGVQDNTLTTYFQKEEGANADAAAIFSVYQSFISLCVMLAVTLASALMKILPPQQVTQWLSAIPLAVATVLWIIPSNLKNAEIIMNKTL